MGTIREHIGENGKKTYRAQIRKKNKELSKSFPDKETTEIFIKYYEMLLDIEKFEAKDLDVYTLGSILSMKYADESREMSEISIYFSEYFLLPMRKIDFKFLMDFSKTMLNSKTKKGGIKGDFNTGIVRDMNPNTVIRKLSYISSAINNAISQGIEIENHTPRVISYVKTYKEQINQQED